MAPGAKIERWHHALKNRILLENDFVADELEAAIAAFIDLRYHESIGNLTPTDVYFGGGETILTERRSIKLQTIQNRLLNPMSPNLLIQDQVTSAKLFDIG